MKAKDYKQIAIALPVTTITNLDRLCKVQKTSRAAYINQLISSPRKQQLRTTTASDDLLLIGMTRDHLDILESIADSPELIRNIIDKKHKNSAINGVLGEISIAVRNARKRHD